MDNAICLDLTSVRRLLLKPDRITPLSAWHQHIPTAFFLIEILRPEVFVELGTQAGDSFAAFCQAVQSLGLHSRCFAIDTWKGDEHAGFYEESVYADLKEYHDDRFAYFSTLIRSTFDDALPTFDDNSIDLLHIDGRHRYEDVKHDYESWLPKMSKRGVVILHDTNEKRDDFGVWKLWEQLSIHYPSLHLPHEHGLGLVCVGSEIPDRLRPFLSAPGADEVVTILRRIGRYVKDEYLLKAEIEHERQQRHQVERDSESLAIQLRMEQSSVEVLRLEVASLRAVEAENEWLASQLQSERSSVEALRLEVASLHVVEVENDSLASQLQSERSSVEALRLEVASLHVVEVENESLASQLQSERSSVEALKREASSLRDQTRRLEDLARSRDELAEKLKSIENSFSWRITSPLRLTRSWLTSVRQLFKATRFELVPNDVTVRSGDHWRGLTDDPFFLLNGRTVPSGWVMVSCDLRFPDGVRKDRVKLYVDAGAGFSEASSLRLRGRKRSGDLSSVLVLPKGARTLRLDPCEGPCEFQLTSVRVRRLLKWQAGLILLARFFGKVGVRSGLRRLRGIDNRVQLIRSLLDERGSYYDWIQEYDTISDKELRLIDRYCEGLRARPLISIVMPVFNPEIKWLSKAIESVIGQRYTNWELCIADDGSYRAVRTLLLEYADKDSRIKVTLREQRGHISRASNSALEMATGDFVALLDHDDVLPPHALAMVAHEINQHPYANVIYSDEDKIDAAGMRYEPYFKPDYDPDLLRSQNVISHLGVYRTALLREVGGFRVGYEGSQDYDLVLRAVAKVPEESIRHIPHVLYHWRAVEGSTALASAAKPYAVEAAKRALESALLDAGVDAEVTDSPGGYHRVRYALPKNPQDVTVIIPTKDGGERLQACVRSVLASSYSKLSVWIVDNSGSEDDMALSKGADGGSVRIVRWTGAYNYSKLHNDILRSVPGGIVVLLNDDTVVISPDWLEEMVSLAVRPCVGAVGAKLLFPDGTIQHAGVIVGGGQTNTPVAAHAFYGSEGDPNMFGRAQLMRGCSAVTAACLVIRKEVFDAVGGFDEELAVAFNDVDLCLKIRKAGYRILWTPFAQLYHLESATRGYDDTPAKKEIHRIETNYIRRKWGRVLESDPFYNPNLDYQHADYGLAWPPMATRPWTVDA